MLEYSTKHKKSPTALPTQLYNTLLWARPIDMTAAMSSRDVTHRLSELVCFPTARNNLRCTTDFHRLDEDAYIFNVCLKRHLGRGTCYLTARALGTIHFDKNIGHARISGRLRCGAFHMLALVSMTLFALSSFLIVATAPLFLPLTMLMLGIVGAHWLEMMHDRQRLRIMMTASLEGRLHPSRDLNAEKQLYHRYTR